VISYLVLFLWYISLNSKLFIFHWKNFANLFYKYIPFGFRGFLFDLVLISVMLFLILMVLNKYFHSLFLLFILFASSVHYLNLRICLPNYFPSCSELKFFFCSFLAVYVVTFLFPSKNIFFHFLFVIVFVWNEENHFVSFAWNFLLFSNLIICLLMFFMLFIILSRSGFCIFVAVFIFLLWWVVLTRTRMDFKCSLKNLWR
jgi:hypothetical protein